MRAHRGARGADGVSVFVTLGFLAAMYLTAALLFGGCAAPLAHARPLESVPTERRASVADTRPCVTAVPRRAKIVSLAEPEKFAYVNGENEDPGVGIKMAVDAPSMTRFFNYVETLEALVKKAATSCYAREDDGN